MHRFVAARLLRRRLRGIIALAVLCGLVAGVGLWGLAAARRTASTYGRYLESATASDASFNVNTFDRPLTADELAEMTETAAAWPQVAGSATYIGLESMALPADVEGAPNPPEFVGSLDGRFLDQDRVAVVEGRLPRVDRAEEILVNEEASRYRDLHVGDTTTIFVADIGAFEAGEIELAGQFEARVVGIAVFADDVLDDEYDRLGRILLTPAGTERWRDLAGSYVWQGLRLHDPADVPEVVAAYRELAGDHAFVNTLITAEQATGVQRAARPLLVGLTILGATALAVAMGLGTIAAGRLARGGTELPLLRSIGVGPRSLRLLGATPALAASLVAAAVAAVVSAALSPLAPVGGLRRIEPERGIDVDWVVVGAGTLVIVGLLVVAGLIASARAGRPRTTSATARARGGWNPPTGLSAAATLGVRRGLGRSNSAATPTRAALGGIGVALVAVLGAVTFGASLDTLSEQPARYGWATDLAVVAGSGYDTIDPEVAGAIADHDERIDGLAVAGYASIELDGQLIPGMGLTVVRGEAPITLLDGTLPRAGREVALGRRTATRLGVSPGEEVDGPDGPLVVSGIVAFPAIGQVTSSHPGMGEGAYFSGGVLSEEEAQPSIAFLDLAADVDADAEAVDLATVLLPATDGGFAEPFSLLRPAELEGAQDATGTVGGIALILGSAAVLGLAAVVLASVRGRAQELAILRVLGFTRADLRRSVRWQAATLSLTAVAVSVPLGVAAGRVVWQAFADTLGVDPSPTVPAAFVGVLAAGTIVIAVASAMPAAHRAARQPVASALRPE